MLSKIFKTLCLIFQVINAFPTLSTEKPKTLKEKAISDGLYYHTKTKTLTAEKTKSPNPDIKKEHKKRIKTADIQPVDYSTIKKSETSFKFKMDNATQRQIDVRFYSGTKWIQSLPWKVKLQPNIYGGEGKDFYFICFNTCTQAKLRW